MSLQPFTLRLPKETIDDIVHRAEVLGKGPSVFGRELITDMLKIAKDNMPSNLESITPAEPQPEPQPEPVPPAKTSWWRAWASRKK